MPFRNVALPWLGGGLIVFGYVGFSWLRAKRTQRGSSTSQVVPRREAVEPLAARLEHVPLELALDLESEQAPANSNGPTSNPGLGASFLGRASDALSPFGSGGKF